METVELTVWGAEEDEALLRQILDSFQARYAGQVQSIATRFSAWAATSTIRSRLWTSSGEK